MKLEIRKDLRGIYNYLLKQGINQYLLSKDFKDFCEENVFIKETWIESENYVNNMSFLLFSFRGKGELVATSFGVFLEKILNLGKDRFIEILLKILKSFYTYKGKEISLYEIHNNIKNLNYSYNEIVECYNNL